MDKDTIFRDLEGLMLLTSAVCHDLDHRGTTNSFQMASESTLASLYSSEGSVMERHHLAQTLCTLNIEVYFNTSEDTSLMFFAVLGLQFS